MEGKLSEVKDEVPVGKAEVKESLVADPPKLQVR